MSEYEGKVHRFECRLCGAPLQHGKRGRPRVYCEKCKPPRRLDKKPSET